MVGLTELKARDGVILDALAREVRRQDVTDVEALDLPAIASAIDSALAGLENRQGEGTLNDGIEPDELTTENDL